MELSDECDAGPLVKVFAQTRMACEPTCERVPNGSALVAKLKRVRIADGMFGRA